MCLSAWMLMVPFYAKQQTKHRVWRKIRLSLPASHMTTSALFECLYALDTHMTTTVSPNMVRIFPPIYTEEDMPFLDVRA